MTLWKIRLRFEAKKAKLTHWMSAEINIAGSDDIATVTQSAKRIAEEQGIAIEDGEFVKADRIVKSSIRVTSIVFVATVDHVAREYGGNLAGQLAGSTVED